MDTSTPSTAATHPAAPIHGSDTLNEIVARLPQTHAVLTGFGLDTCCGGSMPLRKACEAHGLDYVHVLDALTEATR